MTGHRRGLDPAPLLDVAVAQLTDRLGRRPSDNEVGELLGVSRRTVFRWRHGEFRVERRKADSYAVRLDIDDVDLWPELIDDTPELLTAEEMAERWGYGVDHFRRIARTVKGFPKPTYIKLPGRRPTKHWAADDADAWAEKVGLFNRPDDVLGLRRLALALGHPYSTVAVWTLTEGFPAPVATYPWNGWRLADAEAWIAATPRGRWAVA